MKGLFPCRTRLGFPWPAGTCRSDNAPPERLTSYPCPLHASRSRAFARRLAVFFYDDGGYCNRLIPAPDAHHGIFYSGRVENLRPGYSFTLQPGVLGFTSTGTNVNIHRRAELLLGLFTSTRFQPFLRGTMEGSRNGSFHPPSRRCYAAFSIAGAISRPFTKNLGSA